MADVSDTVVAFNNEDNLLKVDGVAVVLLDGTILLVVVWNAWTATITPTVPALFLLLVVVPASSSTAAAAKTATVLDIEGRNIILIVGYQCQMLLVVQASRQAGLGVEFYVTALLVVSLTHHSSTHSHVCLFLT